MESYTLLMLEASGIQNYIFGSNNLRVSVGASQLVRQITDNWVEESLVAAGITSHNIELNEHSVLCRQQAIEEDVLRTEAIYLGGGNALLLFKQPDDALSFTKNITLRILVDAPGLTAVIATIPIDWMTDSLVEKLKLLRSKLAQQKQRPLPSAPLPALPVTATCVFTGEAASGLLHEQEETKLASRSVLCRRDAFPGWEERFVKEFDELRTSDEFSYIAVVHADGNRMGDRITALAEGYEAPAQNRDYANRLRDFSASSHRAAETAVQSVMDLLEHSKQTRGDVWFWQKAGLTEAVRDEYPKVAMPAGKLPFRPVVFGGDDVTFVCDGRLGLTLAHHYLNKYGEQDLADGDKAIGRAGIAIVNTHYPFAQAYQLAADLSDSAKDAGDEGQTASLDWHFAANGLTESLAKTRQRAYALDNGILHVRPWPLTSDISWRQWSTFTGIMSAFDKREEGRNKLKGLMTVLRKGREATEAYLHKFQLATLPQPNRLLSNIAESKYGWAGNQCIHFDALEALDFYIPLSVEEEQHE